MILARVRHPSLPTRVKPLPRLFVDPETTDRGDNGRERDNNYDNGAKKSKKGSRSGTDDERQNEGTGGPVT